MKTLTTSQKIALLTLIGIAFIGMAFAANYWGGNTTIHVLKTDGKNFPAQLAWYSDTTDKQCTDTDGGVKAEKGSYMYFTEADGTTNLVLEQCYDKDTIIEFACSKNVKVKESNGKYNKDYALTFLVDCKDIGKTKCVVDNSYALPTAKCV